MPRAIPLTRELADAMAMDAANAQMRKAGRVAWSHEDSKLAAREFNRLWPLEAEYPWMSTEQAHAIRAQGE